VGPTLLREPLRDRLQHQTHRGADGPQRDQVLRSHDPRVQVRQQAGVVQDETRCPLQVLERRVAAELGQLFARDAIAQLRLVPEREQRLVATRLGSRSRDVEHLLFRQERPLPAPRRPSERAVAADVAAQLRQRDENLRRVRDECAVPVSTNPPRLRAEILERCPEQLVRVHAGSLRPGHSL
jgi:hypothetical protein